MGQQMFKVSGNVVEQATQYPLEYATITLQNTQNSKEILGGITNDKGHFSVEAPRGIYVLKIQFFSFKTYEISHFVLHENKNLGTIRLQDEVAQLDAVEVVGAKTTVEMRLDKKIYNVGDDMIVKGGSVTDVLDNVPSVNVDTEGNISLRGSENVRVLINGKPSALLGMNSETLKQLPSEMIQKVEVITNPSARYDAEGTAGIINIVLKKGKGLGFTGSVNSFLGVADTESAGASVNLNLQKDKFTIFNTTSYRYNRVLGKQLYEQKHLDTNKLPKSYHNEYRDNWSLNKGLSTNLGFEYRPTDDISISNSIVYVDKGGGGNSDVVIHNYDAQHNLISHRFRTSNRDDIHDRWQYTLNYDQNFDKQGHKLSAEYQYSQENEDEKTYITDLQNEVISDIGKDKNHLMKVDYVLPFSKNNQFETGYQGSFKTSDVDYKVFNQILGVNQLNTNYSNHLIYQENIHAWYGQFGTQWNKINAMVGLRIEDTHITISQLRSPNNTSKKNYTSLFPSVFLGYAFSEDNQLMLSYTRRLQRPRSRFINPFTSRSSNTNLFRGNPDLDPTYTNAFDLGYLSKWNQLTFNTSAYYNYSTQVFQFVTSESGELVSVSGIQVPVMIHTPINLANQNRFGIEFTTTYQPKNTLRFTWNINFFKEKTQGYHTYINYLNEKVIQNLNAETSSWFSRLSAKILLPFSVDFQTTAIYTGPKKTAQSDIKGTFSVNLAMSKEILNKKGTLSLNATDLLNSRKTRAYTLTESVQTYSEMQWRPRQIMLNFAYRFGGINNKKKQRSERRSDMDMSSDDMMF